MKNLLKILFANKKKATQPITLPNMQIPLRNVILPNSDVGSTRAWLANVQYKHHG